MKSKINPTEERLTIDRICIEGCVNILSAFLKNLSDDYRLAYYSLIKTPDNEYAREHYQKLKDLFCSEYFYGLTGLDGKAIVEQLDKEYKQEIEEYGALNLGA